MQLLDVEFKSHFHCAIWMNSYWRRQTDIQGKLISCLRNICRNKHFQMVKCKNYWHWQILKSSFRLLRTIFIYKILITVSFIHINIKLCPHPSLCPFERDGPQLLPYPSKNFPINSVPEFIATKFYLLEKCFSNSSQSKEKEIIVKHLLNIENGWLKLDKIVLFLLPIISPDP